MSGPDRIFTSKCGNALVTDHPRWDDDKEYIRRDRDVLAAMPEVQAIVDAAVAAEREACAQEAEGHLNDWSADLAHTFACYVVAQHSGMMNGRKISRDLAIKFAAQFRQRAEAVAEAAEHTAATIRKRGEG